MGLDPRGLQGPDEVPNETTYPADSGNGIGAANEHPLDGSRSDRGSVGVRGAHECSPFAEREATGRAGTPATIAPGGTSRVTTDPAPTIAPAPILTPGRITQ